ncbi:MAG: hypothetical protein RI568_14710 [Natronomonas sp.]|uniref:hypothetical protein n=1 Tax=Natronomonas sp. TaxID=2184060 RepID=UPI002870AC1A|nr:hypothetical protein [Natronomonas sp.]MDR9431933.1 hypothetical protein [Natronomonas sp.]
MVSFADFGLRWFDDIVGQLIVWFHQLLTGGYEALAQETLTTPTPGGSGLDRVFAKPAPSDEPWHSIYEATVAGEMLLFALIVLFVCVQGRHFIRIFDLGSTHEHRRTRRSAVTGGFLIIAWYWVATLLLYVVEALTIGLLPNVHRIGAAMVTMLPQGLDTPILTLFMAGLGAFAVVILRALFFVRELLLYVFLYVMPIAIAVVYGNVPIVSEIAKRLAVQFVSLAMLPLPTALLFRGYGLLFTGPDTIPAEGAFFEYLVVISLPVLAVYVTWKTFSYAAPLASRAVGRAGRGAVLLGSVGTAAYIAGPGAAVATARWGAKGAAGVMASKKYAPSPREQPQQESPTEQQPPQGGVPEYRREENDPAYY